MCLYCLNCTKFGQLILRKIIEIVATMQMSDFKYKMHQIQFRLGLRPRPRWGSLQRSPRPLPPVPDYPGRPGFKTLCPASRMNPIRDATVPDFPQDIVHIVKLPWWYSYSARTFDSSLHWHHCVWIIDTKYSGRGQLSLSPKSKTKLKTELYCRCLVVMLSQREYSHWWMPNGEMIGTEWA